MLKISLIQTEQQMKDLRMDTEDKMYAQHQMDSFQRGQGSMRLMLPGLEGLKDRGIPEMMTLLPTRDPRREHMDIGPLDKGFPMDLADQMPPLKETGLWQMVGKALPPALPEGRPMAPWPIQGAACPLQAQSLRQTFPGFGRAAEEAPPDRRLIPPDQMRPCRAMAPWPMVHRASPYHLLAGQASGAD